MSEGLGSEPDAQLQVFAAEVVRQREENARRQGNMHSRAGVLVAAAGIITGLHLDHPTWWVLFPAGLAAVTAVLGLTVLITRSRDEPVAKQETLEQLGDYTPYAVRYTIVEDNLTGLCEGRKLLKTKAGLINVGYVLLAATWAAQIVVEVTTRAGS